MQTEQVPPNFFLTNKSISKVESNDSTEIDEEDEYRMELNFMANGQESMIGEVVMKPQNNKNGKPKYRIGQKRLGRGEKFPAKKKIENQKNTKIAWKYRTRSFARKSSNFYSPENQAEVPELLDRASFSFKKLIILKSLVLKNREWKPITRDYDMN